MSRHTNTYIREINEEKKTKTERKASACDTDHSRIAAIFDSIRFLLFSFSFSFAFFSCMFLKQCLQQTKSIPRL